jgi:hypothetical protein
MSAADLTVTWKAEGARYALLISRLVRLMFTPNAQEQAEEAEQVADASPALSKLAAASLGHDNAPVPVAPGTELTRNEERLFSMLCKRAVVQPAPPPVEIYSVSQFYHVPHCAPDNICLGLVQCLLRDETRRFSHRPGDTTSRKDVSLVFFSTFQPINLTP